MPTDKKAGRVHIKMTALTINTVGNYNRNGITWLEQYVQDNIDSIIGAPYVVNWLIDKEIPSDHGTMSHDDEGNAQFEGESVGTIQDAYIEEVEIDGAIEKRLVTEGYLFRQRVPKFIKFLKEKIEIDGEHIKGSIEITGKGDAKQIEYLDGRTNDDGTVKIGRTPTVFDFSGLAILYLETPADSGSEIIELNTLQNEHYHKEEQNMKKVKSKQSIEINELSFDDIATLVTRAFNVAMKDKKDYDDGYYYRYWIYKFYPVSNRVIMYNDCETPYKYYSVTYEILNNSITLGDVVEVEMDFKPVADEQEVNINTKLIKDILQNSQKEENLKMENDTTQNVSVVELNSQIVEKVNEINTLSSQIKDKDIEINALKEKEVELNQAILDATKTIETLKKENTELNSEIEPLRLLKEEQESAKAKAEINTYFEAIKSENGFSESELNTLKTEYVDKCDLEGLKSAETELCVKKVKELKKVDKMETEVNSAKMDDNLFFSTKVETVETNTSNDGSELFR
jgi:hypothetical protein